MYRFMFALALVGCANPTKDKVEAKIVDPVEAPATQDAKGDTWKAVLAQSEIRVIGAKITAEHWIVFPNHQASVKVDDGVVTELRYEADVTTLESDHPKLTKHLKAEEFLFVDQYPKSTFVSTSIVKGAEGGTHTVTGDLTLRGKTKRISFPATLELKGDTLAATAEFAINRQDFEVTYPGRPDDLVQDKVLMKIKLTAKAGQS